MKSVYYLLGALVFLTSCATDPALRLQPLAGTTEKINCGDIFPQGKWQFVHSLEFSLADGKTGSLLGISVIDDPVIDCVLMTIEGFVLFEGRYDQELEIKRAVSPFDNREFALGLIRDLQLIFFQPPAKDIRYGKNAAGRSLCRYMQSSGQCVDIVLLPEQGWEIDQYGSDEIKTRIITAGSKQKAGQWPPPAYMQLTACGSTEYTLKMTLISAEKISE